MGSAAMERPPGLPDYGNPPIDEVAISVQFPSVDGLLQPHFGLFWSQIRAQYPRVETQPRIEGPIESLDISTPPQLQQIQIPLIPLSGRTWYISEADDFLVQLQDTRFVQNWRKRAEMYPHFEAIASRFWSGFDTLRTLLREEGLPKPVVQQVEINYINWIPDLPASAFLKLGAAATLSIPGLGEQPENQDWFARYLVTEEHSAVGRIYVICQFAFRTEPSSQPGPGTQFSLTYRTPSLSGMSDEHIQRHMKSGRELIVRTFTGLTTDGAQEAWGRTR